MLIESEPFDDCLQFNIIYSHNLHKASWGIEIKVDKFKSLLVYFKSSYCVHIRVKFLCRFLCTRAVAS